jgi:polyhydroxyalkanoate synthase
MVCRRDISEGDDMAAVAVAKARSAKNEVTPGRVRRPKARGKTMPKRPRATAKPQSVPALLAEGRNGETHTIGTTSETLSGQFGFGNFRPGDLFDTAKHVAKKLVRQPGPMLRSRVGLAGELLKVLAGLSTLVPEPGDKRFADPAWRESWVNRRVLQSYLAWAQSLQRYATSSSDDAQENARVAFLMTQIASALAPTNALVANPSALKKAIDTGGKSLLRGLSNLLNDLAAGRVMPSQSDDRPFKVGENLACTPGAVVLRTEMFELLQYAPQTPSVHERPMLFIPPIINKYYVFDLAPGRSLIEHFIRKGLTVFLVAWRNPRPEHDHWGNVEYQESIDQAIDAVVEIGGTKEINLWGVCGAAPTVASLLAYHAATAQRKVHSLVLMVPLLDMSGISQTEGVGAFTDRKTMSRFRPRQPRRVSAREFGLLFGLMRPNDLIWNYWVNNYLLGNDPPVFDVLTWNGDGSGMTARFAADFADLVRDNPLVERGRVQVRGVPIVGLDELGIDAYVIGAATDHICRWPSVYRAAQMLGERCEFVLGDSGHIQTLVCPPDNPKAGYYTNASKPASAEQWLAEAGKQSGTWWDHCADWMAKRSGPQLDAPKAPGNARHPPVGRAPGDYVLERA